MAAWKKALVLDMLPRRLRLADRLKLARDLGFEGIEAGPESDERRLHALREAAASAGIEIHSIMNASHWRHPLSAAEPEVVERGVKGLEAALRTAAAVGADTVLLVPAVVDARTPYREAYERSRHVIGSILPLAGELGVSIAIENVWNKFLLSPLEFARYVDAFEDSRLGVYFDVGNVVLFGFPQDWIRTLGPRIRKVHVKDFDARRRQFVPLREGTVDWRAVREALTEVGYAGYLTAELPRGNASYLREVSRRMDRIIAG